MTVSAIIGIIVTIIIMAIGIGIGISFIKEGGKASFLGSTILICSLILGGSIIFGICFWQFGTESGARALKSQEINFNGGIERAVEVYDMNGNLIKTYSGKFDVDCKTETETPYIVFDDENGKRHMVFYPTGTIVIDEK